MKKCPYSTAREKIVAQALGPVATELRLLDAGDLISLVRFECYSSLADLVSSAAELYFHPGTVSFGAGGEYRLEWGGPPEITLDLEIRPRDITIYVRLTLTDQQASIEIDHISFQDPSENPDDNTAFLSRSLQDARFVPTSLSQV